MSKARDFGVTPFGGDNDDRTDEKGTECRIEHRAPGSSGVMSRDHPADSNREGPISPL